MLLSDWPARVGTCTGRLDRTKLSCVLIELLSARLLALTGLRAQYPQASEAELRRRLAGLLLGEELARKVYGEISHRGRSAMQNEPLEVTLKVTNVFEKLGVAYLIGGSLASTL